MKMFRLQRNKSLQTLVVLLLAGGAVTAGHIFYAMPAASVNDSVSVPTTVVASVPAPADGEAGLESAPVAAPAAAASDNDDPTGTFLNCDAEFDILPGGIDAGRISLLLQRMNPDVEAAGLSSEITLPLLLPWAHGGARATDFDAVLRRPPGMVHGGIRDWLQLLPDGLPRMSYAGLRPGVDLLLYTELRQGELVFVFWPGADRFAPRLLLQDAALEIMPDGVRWDFDEGQLILGEPRTGRFDGGMLYLDEARFHGAGEEVAITLPPRERQDRDIPAVDNDLRLIPGGGQPGGPEYSFYLSRYPATNADFVKFLNDAEAHADTLRGRNMYYAANGDVWINPDMRPGEHELFRVDQSFIEYDGDAPTGRRYRVSADVPQAGHSYSNHPVTGVSWFGAVKYCNWLTLKSGRGAEALCYSEGTNRLDWAPVTSHPTNWANGRFTQAERHAWLDVEGYRLPMDNSTGRVSRADMFNEYYKAAAWNGVTNMAYGFGRNVATRLDANYDDTLLQGTSPVGFFDGTNEIKGETTATNENFYGIYGLSGNVAEWLSCPAGTDSPNERNLRGGGWDASLPRTDQRRQAPPETTGPFGGFRVGSMAADLEMLVVRIPYRICLLDIEPVEPPVEPPEEPLDEPRDPFEDLPVIAPPDIRYRDPPTLDLPPPPPPCPSLI